MGDSIGSHMVVFRGAIGYLLGGAHGAAIGIAAVSGLRVLLTVLM